MRLSAAPLAALVASALPVLADGEAAGEFDYYILALTWTPSWCATTGDSRDDPQCDAGRGLGFTLHGLWPQDEFGWPSHCRTTEREPSRAETAAMADIMGSSGLAWYEWKKHGRCSGLSAGDYFALSREAYESIDIPEVFERLNRDVTLPAQVVEDAFIDADPGLTDAMMTTQCGDGRISEVRICLSRDLSPRPCGPDASRDCRMTDALMEALR
jgi:ribonuclease T2